MYNKLVAVNNQISDQFIMHYRTFDGYSLVAKYPTSNNYGFIKNIKVIKI